MKEFFLNHKKIVAAVLILLLLLVVFWDNLPFEKDSSNAENIAILFLKNMLDGNAKECADLMCNDLIDSAGYETKKLFINAFEKNLEVMIEAYKDKYGKRWEYEISVIDSFEYNPEYYYYNGDGKLIKVVLKIEHKGGGLFKDEDGNDEVEIIIEEINGKCLVYDLPV